MKWLFFLSFIAAIICSVIWSALIVFAFVTSRVTPGKGFLLIGGLMFFVWGAQEMFRSFTGVGLNE